MSDLRYDPVTGTWVTIAPNRNDRPIEFVPAERVIKRLLCPFCAGNESETPKMIAAYDRNGETTSVEDDWLVRVVPNKYPSFSVFNGESVTPDRDEDVPKKGFYQSQSAHGIQELIIPTSRHLNSLSQLSNEESVISLVAYQERIKAAGANGLQHAMLFTNCRSSAGASLEHIHTQLIASPILSESVVQRVNRNTDHVAQHGEHLIHSLTRWEQEQETRIVDSTDHFSLVCPYASRFAFQMWIVPNVKLPSFLECPFPVLEDLAVLIHHQVRRLELILDDPAYNVLFHLAPFKQMDSQPWFVEIFPRLTTPAGFELGTDIWVNPVAPETATRRLKQVDLQ